MGGKSLKMLSGGEGNNEKKKVEKYSTRMLDFETAPPFLPLIHSGHFCHSHTEPSSQLVKCNHMAAAQVKQKLLNVGFNTFLWHQPLLQPHLLRQFPFTLSQSRLAISPNSFPF